MTNVNPLTKSAFEAGASVEEIANYKEHKGLGELLIWTMVLNGKSDLERFELYGKSEYSNNQPKLMDVWNFMRGDLRVGRDYPGRLWCQDVMNILYRYQSRAIW